MGLAGYRQTGTPYAHACVIWKPAVAHGWGVLLDMSSPGKLYGRYTPASAVDQLWIDCSLSVL